MRRGMIILAASLLALLSAAATAERGGNGSPSLTIARATPLTVRGVRFRPAEQVRVVVAAERKTKLVTASAAGGFSAQFPTVAYDRCNALIVRAVGSRGSRATLKRPELQCPPAL